MRLLAYALASATVFQLVFVLWQGLAGRVETDLDDRLAAFRAARLFGLGAAATAVAALAAYLVAVLV